MNKKTHPSENLAVFGEPARSRKHAISVTRPLPACAEEEYALTKEAIVEVLMGAKPKSVRRRK